jgi:hypothetical protein
MTSTLPKGTLGSVASLLAAILYQGNPDGNHKLWNIISSERYIRSFPHSQLITGFVTRLTRRVPLVEQELLTLPEHPSSPTVFCGVRVTRSLVLYICFADRCLAFCTFSFGRKISLANINSILQKNMYTVLIICKNNLNIEFKSIFCLKKKPIIYLPFC